VRVKVTAALGCSSDWGALGYFAGKLAGLGIPVFDGAPRPSQDDAKQLCAALATSGGVTMCHIAGVTPEAATLEDAFQGAPPGEAAIFDDATLRAMYASLRNHTAADIDSVILGCPHASIREISEFAALLKGKRVAPGVRPWVDTARATKASADAMGFTGVIEEAGASSFATPVPPTCASPPAGLSRTASSRRITCGMVGAEVIVAKTDACVRAAVAGRWTGDD
jgi:predicted aconitase